MELLNPIVFSVMRSNSAEVLIKIAKKYVGKYLNKDEAKKFIVACKDSDYKRANMILDDTIKSMSGCSSIISALVNYSEKFSAVGVKLSEVYTEKGMIESINEKSEAILQVINKKNRRKKMENVILMVLGVLLCVITVAVILKYAIAKMKKERYTEKDRDMIMLIKDLSEIYSRTDEYLKK